MLALDMLKLALPSGAVAAVKEPIMAYIEELEKPKDPGILIRFHLNGSSREIVVPWLPRVGDTVSGGEVIAVCYPVGMNMVRPIVYAADDDYYKKAYAEYQTGKKQVH